MAANSELVKFFEPKDEKLLAYLITDFFLNTVTEKQLDDHN